MARPALAATRAVAVLHFLAANASQEFTLSEIAARLGVNVASMHAVLGALAEAGLVQRHPRLRTFTLGPAVVALGDAALERHAAIDVARDEARRLAASIGREVAVTAPAGEHIVFLARAGPHSARGLSPHVGQRVPFEPPLGSVFVAWDDATWWLDRAHDAETMAEVLAAVRARGYAVALEADARRGLGLALADLAGSPSSAQLQATVRSMVHDLARRDYQLRNLDPSATYDVSMLAAPVFGDGGEVKAALAVVGFDAPLHGAEVVGLGEQLRDAALVATHRSRGRAPSSVVPSAGEGGRP